MGREISHGKAEEYSREFKSEAVQFATRMIPTYHTRPRLVGINGLSPAGGLFESALCQARASCTVGTGDPQNRAFGEH
jgi:hypothetical protein